MTDTNPYRAPSDLSTVQQSQLAGNGSIGIEFESDWSPEGLRQRRKSPRQPIADIAIALLTLVWVASLVASPGSPYAGFICLLTPVWIVSCVAWIANFSSRTGELFRKKYPGLAGRVHGKISGQLVVIHGPAVSLVARRTDCLICRVRKDHAILQPPAMETRLRIAEQDIVNSWPIEGTALLHPVTSAELLAEIGSAEDQVLVEGDLRGSDFRKESCWRTWLTMGSLSMAVSATVIVWCILTIVRLPSWILDPPDHYRLSDDDMWRIVLPSIFLVIFGIVLLFGLWLLSRTWRPIGRFSALVTPSFIAIVSKRVTLGYHHQGLDHFQWTPTGIVARDAGKRTLFVLPVRWFNDAQQTLVKAWFSRTPTAPRESHYFGPKI